MCLMLRGCPNVHCRFHCQQDRDILCRETLSQDRQLFQQFPVHKPMSRPWAGNGLPGLFAETVPK